MSLRTLQKVKNVKGKVVLLRVDFNVPIHNKKVVDDSRIIASLPTIDYLIEKQAKIIIVTHIGRPEGKYDATLSVDPVLRRLSALLEKKVTKLSMKDWSLSRQFEKQRITLLKQIESMNPGDVAMLENIRFSSEEETNGERLSQELANLADMFVLDGFAVAHRAAASVVGVAKYIPSYAGLLLSQEIAGLDKVMNKAKSPFVVVLGGAKTETKLPIIKQLLPKADAILVGGGILTTYLAGAGYGVGASLVDKEFLKEAVVYGKKKKVILPLDVIVGKKDGTGVRVVSLEKKPHVICKKTEAIFDIGPASIGLFASYIKTANTLVWNGAMGYFEQKPYDVGTLSLARLVASRSKGPAFGVIGGGETVQAMELVDMTDSIDLVSTGGGAMLEYLSGKKLPGVVAVQTK